MLTIFYGGDKEKTRREAGDFINSALKEKENLVRFDETTFNLETLLSAAQNQGLFGGIEAIFIDRVLEREEYRDLFFEIIPVLITSNVPIVLFEENIDTPLLSCLKEEGVSDIRTSKRTAGKKKEQRFNTFLLADALGDKDKKKLWVLYERAKREGISAEEIVGTLFWQLKTLLLVEKNERKSLNPFVLRKAQNFLKNYKDGETLSLAFKLVSLYHNGRSGGPEIELGLEKFILAL